MPTINHEKLNLIKKYYSDGFSAREIGEKLNVSIDAVYYFFRKNNIARRNMSEVRSVVYGRQESTFKIKTRLTDREKALKTAGVMLYWGEGSKWAGEKIVDFANSDVDMIKVFLNFLRIICNINEEKLRVYLYCYSNQNPELLEKYWSKITNIQTSQFTKPYIRKDYDSNKAGKMKYGLIHIRYGDKKLLDIFRKWINDYVKKLS